MSTILVVNAGSSSVKYQLIDVDDDTVVSSGRLERIGEDGAHAEHTFKGETTARTVPADDHHAALRQVVGLFDEVGPRPADMGLVAVGHRVVMGGAGIDRPASSRDRVVAEIEALSPLAPLHNPPNLAAIAVAQANCFPRCPTSPCSTPRSSTTCRRRPRPTPSTTRSPRRTRCGATASTASPTSTCRRRRPRWLGRDPDDLRQIVLHLGNGASASAVSAGGRSTRRWASRPSKGW